MGLKLEAEIGLNAASFQRGITQVNNSISNTVKSYALGAVGVYSIEKAFAKTLETVKELYNESKRMGVSVENLQVMRKAAASAGVEMSTLAGAMEKLNVARSKALGGDSKALASFGALGVSKERLETAPAEDIIFGEISKKIKSVNPQDIAAQLRDVMGRGYGEMVPLMAKDMDALREKMQRMGMIISSETVAELKQFDAAINSLKNLLVGYLAQALASFGDGLMKFWMENASPLGSAIQEGIAVGASREGGGAIMGSLRYAVNTILPEELGGMTDKEYAKEYSSVGDAYSQAMGVGKETYKNWKKELGDSLNVKPTEFTPPASGDNPIHHTAGDLRSNSLISHGNYFGQIQGSMPNFEQRKVDLLTQINAGITKLANAPASAGDDHP
jgi:uncharacterized protein (DUF433 family)